MFRSCVITCLILICLKTSQTSSERIISKCHPDIDIRFGEERANKSTLWIKKPYSEVLSYVANGFLSTTNFALKLAGNDCKEDICRLARNKVDVTGITEIEMAYTALTNMPYGLRLLLCSDVVIRSITFGEIVLADEEHDNKAQTARTKSVVNAPYKWRFEPVNGVNQLQFRIRNVKTNQYLVAERKFSQFGESLRRVALTDPKKMDIWELKMMSEVNGDFNRFSIMNVQLGEYLYASRGFCYDNDTDVNDCSTRPMFTWEYKTLNEAEQDEYNRFIIDENFLD